MNSNSKRSQSSVINDPTGNDGGDNWVRRSVRQRAPTHSNSSAHNTQNGHGSNAANNQKLLEQSKQLNYRNIQEWNKAMWDEFLTESSSNGHIPRRVLARFGQPCFVRQSLSDMHMHMRDEEGDTDEDLDSAFHESSSSNNSPTSVHATSSIMPETLYVPALELSPLHVIIGSAAPRKYNLCRQWLLALDAMRQSATPNSCTTTADDPHLVYFYGVKFGDNLTAEELKDRSKQPFALISDCDYLSFEHGYALHNRLPASIEAKLERAVTNTGQEEAFHDLLQPCEEEILDGIIELNNGLSKVTTDERVAFLSEHYRSDRNDDDGDVDSSTSSMDISSNSSEKPSLEVDTGVGTRKIGSSLSSSEHFGDDERSTAAVKREDDEPNLHSNQNAPQQRSQIIPAVVPSAVTSELAAVPSAVSVVNTSAPVVAVPAPPKKAVQRKPKGAMADLMDLEKEYGITSVSGTVIDRIRTLFKVVFGSDVPQNKVKQNIDALKAKMKNHCDRFKEICDEWGIDSSISLAEKLAALSEVIGTELEGSSFDEKFSNMLEQI